MADAVDAVDWDALGDDLLEAVQPYHVDLLKMAYGEADNVLPVSVSFSQQNPRVKDVLGQMGDRIKGVADTVKDNAKRVISDGIDAGKTNADIAKALREYGVTDSQSRSMLIARTESATAYNQGSLLAYGDANVETVTVMDGDDDEECAAADGQEWTLEEAAANPIAHPNCTRAFSPNIR